MSRPPRLLHVAASDLSLHYLLGVQLQAFVAAGYEVLGASAAGPTVPQIEASGVVHLPLEHMTRGKPGAGDLQALRELRALFARHLPDIVHTHTPKAGVLGRLAARTAGVPLVVNTQHGLYATETDGLAKRVAVLSAERFAATCSQVELVQNAEDMETLRRVGIPARRLVHLGNGIDLARFDRRRLSPTTVAETRDTCGAAPEDVLVVAVGRLVREKGYLELFAAAEALAGKHPRIRFAVVGGPEPTKEDGLDEADRSRAEGAGVTFLGHVDDVERIYAAADLLAHPSHREGMPRAPMEAAALGVPSVATDIRGCRQVVDHRRTGLLVPPRDASALAGAIADLAADPDRRHAFGAAARARAMTDFDEQRVVDTVCDTYERLLAGRPGLTRRTLS